MDKDWELEQQRTPSIFISITPKAGHDQAVFDLLHVLTKFCDEHHMGWVPTSAHRFPDSKKIVLSIELGSHEQKDDFLHAEAYHNFRIDLLKHAEAKDIYVGK